MPSPYEVLRIDPDADETEVELAYRRRVKETHPDHGGSARAFRRVREAYEEIVTRAVDDADVRPRRDGEDDASPRGADDAPDHAAAPGERGADDSRQEGSRVEYIDYEVLDDHGWGLDDEGLFEKASDEGLDPADHGRLKVEPRESLLQAAQNRGFTWPYACRGGACANCAVAVTEGDLSLPVDHILPQEMVDRGIRLSCVGAPTTDGTKVVYNVKHLPDLDELRLPPGPFERARSSD